MARGKKHSSEQVVNTLRQIEVAVATSMRCGRLCVCGGGSGYSER